MDYLEETYGGQKNNSLSDMGYCCYTIYDVEREKYYSGMKSFKGSECPLGKSYFTSSTVKDFKERFVANPNKFKIKVEYFNSMSEIVEAEKKFHSKFDVGRNRKFYNCIVSSGSNCGSGSVLCRDSSNSTYRVSMEEYAEGNHIHVCSNSILVYTKDDPDKLIRVNRKDFDEKLHITQFANFVMCFDKNKGRIVRIHKDLYYSNPDRYYGHTKNKITVYERETNKKIQIDCSRYDRSKHYVKTQSKSIKVVNTESGEISTIDRNLFNSNRALYKSYNSLFRNVFDVTDMKKKKIPTDEYDPKKHSLLMNRYILKYKNKFYTSFKYIELKHKNINKSQVAKLKMKDFYVEN